METPELLPVAMTPQNTKDYLAILKRRWDKIYDDTTINHDTFQIFYKKLKEHIRVYIEHKMNLSWCTDIPDSIKEWAVTVMAHLFTKYLYADTDMGNRWENEKFRDKNIDLFFYGEQHVSNGFCKMFVKEKTKNRHKIRVRTSMRMLCYVIEKYKKCPKSFPRHCVPTR